MKATQNVINGKNRASRRAPVELLAGIKALKMPACKLSVPADRNAELLHALLCAYEKHALNSRDIGWEELGDILLNAICNEIGDEAFCKWLARMDADNEVDLSWD